METLRVTVEWVVFKRAYPHSICLRPQLEVFTVGNSFFVHHELGGTWLTEIDPTDLKNILVAIQESGTVGAVCELLAKTYDRSDIHDTLTLLRDNHMIVIGGEDTTQPKDSLSSSCALGLRARRILIIGNTVMAARLGELLKTRGCTVNIETWICPEQLTSEAYLQARKRHLLFSNGGSECSIWPQMDNVEALRSQIREADCVVAMMEGTPFALVQWLRDEVVAADIPLLPVNTQGTGLGLGPLILPPNLQALEYAVLGPKWSHHSKFADTSGFPLALTLPSYRGTNETLSCVADCLCAEKDWNPTACWQTINVNIDISSPSRISMKYNAIDREADSKYTFLPSYLNHDIFGDASTVNSIKEALRAGELVSIPQAFEPEFAEAVYAALNESNDWKVYEDCTPWFYFHHHNLYDFGSYPAALRAAFLVFDNPATRSWISELSGRDCEGNVSLSASYYMPGDHSTPHSDADSSRQVAFIWHLTKDWSVKWGGCMYWSPANTLLAPLYNHLYLFCVSEHSTHFVQKVAPWARGKRLTVNGWWRTSGVVQRPQVKGAAKRKVGPVELFRAYPWVVPEV